MTDYPEGHPANDRRDKRANDTVAGSQNSAYAHAGGYGPADSNLTDESGQANPAENESESRRPTQAQGQTDDQATALHTDDERS